MRKMIKKLLVVTLVFLFIVSITKDLTTGTFPASVNENEETTSKQITQPSTTSKATTNTVDQPLQSNKRFETIQYKVKAGETVLSIIERLNKQGNPVTIQQMLKDFEDLNPNTNPHQIETNEPYYFPVYRQNENDM
ncbi:hypothetical protein GLW08_09135 [Pontibacillus yanchengensis]|uniref:Uncharacterized protein n=2 Tax=Pontibacillus yanchengensis TaxID=462910 RepID=A0ACC7VDJ3_9BACI|nr:hypothetical protein [Pontibacillus yanchengensis]MYL33453.1 hypothetical protein [Pontibacillus yanchengensis]MYL53503.1 hypothetical protein [Pontibacillus yanchengensis]